MTFWLCLLFLPLSFSYVCKSIVQWTTCAENESPDEVLKEILKEDGWQGQADAVQQVMSLLKENLYRKRKKPLVLHFSGPTAVGKTSLAKALARALFQQYEDDEYVCGLLFLKMEVHLKNTPSNRLKETFQKVIADPILEQLSECPRSVILLDEIQHAHIQLIEELKNALNDNALFNCQPPLCPRTRPYLSTKDSIFIMTSDLEPKDAKRLTPDTPKDEATGIILDLAATKWGERTLGVEMMKVITVVPFLPLSGFDLHNILTHKIKDLEKSIRQRLNQQVSILKLPYKVRWLGEVLPQKGTEAKILLRLDRALGFRVVDNFLSQHAMPMLDDIVEELVSLAATKPFVVNGGWFSLATHVVLHNIEVQFENELTIELVPGESSDDAFRNRPDL